MITDIENTRSALNALRSTADGLKEIQLDAQTAADTLVGARAARARELAEMIADTLAHAERLTFIVQGDVVASTRSGVMFKAVERITDDQQQSEMGRRCDRGRCCRLAGRRVHGRGDPPRDCRGRRPNRDVSGIATKRRGPMSHLGTVDRHMSRAGPVAMKPNGLKH